MQSVVKKISTLAAAVIVGLTAVTAYAACVNNYLPQSYLQLLSVNPDGSKSYVIYKWDSDSAAVPGNMALYRSNGTLVVPVTGAGYINITQPRGAGYWHLDITDVNSCGAFVRWLHGVVLVN